MTGSPTLALRALRDLAATPEHAGLLGEIADKVHELELSLEACRADRDRQRNRANNAESRQTELEAMLDEAKPLVERLDEDSGVLPAAKDWLRRWRRLR